MAKVEKTRIANHDWLDASGQVCDDIEDAVGIRYVDIASGTTFDYVPANEKAKQMTSLFGCRTLATNEASAARQNDATGVEQVDAVRERFAGIDAGQWVDKTREGGPRIDLPSMATASVEVNVANGKVANDDAAKLAAYTKILAKFEADRSLASKMKTNPAVDAAYRRIRGAKVASADELADLLS